jgi:hypothetical protein
MSVVAQLEKYEWPDQVSRKLRRGNPLKTYAHSLSMTKCPEATSGELGI